MKPCEDQKAAQKEALSLERSDWLAPMVCFTWFPLQGEKEGLVILIFSKSSKYLRRK